MKTFRRKFLSLLLTSLLLFSSVLSTGALKAEAITVDQVSSALTTIQKISSLSQTQALQAVDIAQAAVDNVGINGTLMETSEINKLKAKGLTKADVNNALIAVCIAITDTTEWSKLTSTNSTTQLNAVVTLVNQVVDNLGNTFINNLQSKGITTEDLVLAVLDLVNVQISAWDNLPQVAIETIFDEYSINPGISQATAASYGVNWENVQETLDSLTSTQKSQLQAILVALGSWVTTSSGGGDGGGGTTTPVTEPVQNEEQNQQVNQNVTQQVQQVINNIATMDTSTAITTVTAAINTIIQTAATATTETRTTIATAAAATVTRAATMADSAVTTTVNNNRATVSVDATAVTQKVTEMVSLVSSMTAQLNEAKMSDVAQKSVESNKKVVIEVTKNDNVNQSKEVAVNIPAAAVSAMKENGVAMEIKAHEISFNIPSKALPSTNQNEVMEVTASKVTTEEAKDTLNQVSASETEGSTITEMVEITISKKDTSNGTTSQVTTFSEKIRVAIRIDPQKVNDPEILGVYRYNEETKTWEHKGGKVDMEAGTVTAQTDHFSLYAVMEYKKTFNDINGHWAKRQVEVLASKHIIKGMTDTTFAPDQKVTRAQFATLIAKVLELDDVPASAAKFSDVAANSWYRGAVGAAVKAGIISGYNANTFGPEDLITREQAAVMVSKALEYNQSAVSIDDKNINSQLAAFADKGTISSWAQKGVALLKQEGILTGYEGKVMPTGNTTRSEAAVMLYKTLNKM